MKIALFCSVGGWGGLEQNAIKTADWLTQAGMNITLIVQEGTRVANASIEKGIPTIFFQHKHKHYVWNDAKKLAHIMSEHQFDVLIIGHSVHFYISVWAKYYTQDKLKLVYWQHMQMPVRRRDFYHASFYRKIDKWIVPLDYLREELKKTTTLQEKQVVQIPQVIDTTLFLPAKAQKLEARRSFQFEEDDFLVGNIGRIDSQKGQEYLVQAGILLAQKKLPIKIFVMGENNQYEDYLGYLKRLVEEAGLAEMILFRPFTTKTPEAFAAMDIFVMCSLSEPIGMVTLEAMATQVPVIGTNTGGTPELLAEGKAGLLVPPKDAIRLAEAIEKLYQDKDLCKTLVENALQEVTQKYDIPQQVHLFKQLFENL